MSVWREDNRREETLSVWREAYGGDIVRVGSAVILSVEETMSVWGVQ